jgi:hypothetical protein
MPVRNKKSQVAKQKKRAPGCTAFTCHADTLRQETTDYFPLDNDSDGSTTDTGRRNDRERDDPGVEGLQSLYSVFLPPHMHSTIIEDIKNLHKTGHASLAMYYYDFREDEKKDLCGLLSSVLFQLCDQSNSYYNILSTFYLAHRDGKQSPSDSDLVRCLTELFRIPAPVYLVVDGLDECPSTSALSSPREEVLSFLEDLVEARLPNLRICVTSRPEADIKPVLEPLTFCSISLHDESGQKDDIENYIRMVVNTNRKMRRWTPEHKQLVIEVLTERADGM